MKDGGQRGGVRVRKGAGRRVRRVIGGRRTGGRRSRAEVTGERQIIGHHGWGKTFTLLTAFVCNWSAGRRNLSIMGFFRVARQRFPPTRVFLR